MLKKVYKIMTGDGTGGTGGVGGMGNYPNVSALDRSGDQGSDGERSFGSVSVSKYNQL